MQTLRRQRKQQFEKILLEEKIYSTSQEDRERLLSKLLDAAESRTERKTDDLKGEYKPDLVDLELSKLPAMSIRQAVHEYFRLNTNWETKYNRQWMEWAVEQGITAEQIKTAAETWRSDKAFNWQVPSLKGIFEKWQMLMDAQPEQSPVERRIKNLERDL